MISVLFNFFFVFNMQIEDRVAKEIKRQLDTLQYLYLTDFEVIMLKSDSGMQKMRLYEDPVIDILCPDDIDNEAFRNSMLSLGVMEGLSIDYDLNARQFIVDKDIDEIIDMFKGNQTLLFVGMPL